MRKVLPAWLCVTSWAYLDIPFFRAVDHVMEPFLFIACAVTAAILLRKGRVYKGLTRSEAVLFLLVIIVVVRALFSAPASAMFVPSAGVLFLFYLAIRQWLLLTDPERLQHTLRRMFTVLLSGYLLFAVIYVFVMGEQVLRLSRPNGSVFAVQLAGQMVFLITLAINQKKVAGCGLLVTGCAILLLCMNGRAGWLGVTVSLFLFMFLRSKTIRRKRVITIAGILIVAVLFIFLMGYKRGSSEGRGLIYTVSLRMLRDNWITGMGPGQFALKYNSAQAEYFTTHDINSSSAMRAGNTIYAFNEFLQWWAEHGLICFILLLYFIYLLFWQENRNRNAMSDAALCSLACAVITSLFSYPFHFLPAQLHVLFCVAIIEVNILRSEVTRRAPIPFAGSLYFLIAVFSIFCFARKAIVLDQSMAAFMLSMSGNKKAALHIYERIATDRFTDGHTLYLYAKLLWDKADTTKARMILEKASRSYLDADLVSLSAVLSQAGGQKDKARTLFKQAVCLQPSRMRSRFAVFRFSLATGDSVAARYWAREILALPARLQDPYIIKVREQAGLFLADPAHFSLKMP